MAITLSQLAQVVGGQLHGDGDLEVTGASILRDAQAGDITLCDRADRLKKLDGCAASAVLLPEGLAAEYLPYITVADVAAAFTRIVLNFRPRAAAERSASAPQPTSAALPSWPTMCKSIRARQSATTSPLARAV